MVLSNFDVARRYYRSHKNTELFIRSLDTMLSIFFGRPELATVKPIPTPEKLLLTDGAHLGDTIILTSLLTTLKRALPSLKVGILTGSWNREILSGSRPQFDYMHFLDHWYLDRAPKPRAMLLAAYARKGGQIVTEIHDNKYDAAINMRPWFPNFVPILWRANVPIRIGFNRGSFTPLLTHYIPFKYERKPVRSFQADLLATIGIERNDFDELPTPWLQSTALARNNFRRVLGLGPSQAFAILHIGASTPIRNWRNDRWRELAYNLIKRGFVPVFTGVGETQNSDIIEIISGLAECINACGMLSFDFLVAAVEQAKLVICVETSIGHLAASLGVPCVSIYGGMLDPKMWGPVGRRTALVTNELPCNPCFKMNGCKHLSCLQEINVRRVEQAIENVLS